MKKRLFALTLIAAILMTAMSAVVVWADDDEEDYGKHGEDAHSQNMYNMEDQEEYEEEPGTLEIIEDFALTYLPFIAGAVCLVIIIIIAVRLIRGRARKPGRYRGKHDRS